MKESNLQIALGIAIIVIIVLLMRPPADKGEASRKPRGGLNQAGMDLADKLGMLAGSASNRKVRRVLEDEDETVLIPHLEDCSTYGYADAPPPVPGNPGCHITCGGGGTCGSGPEGIDSETGKPMLQKCCHMK